MKELAPDVWQLGGLPPNGINVYVIGDVLVDAATRRAGRRILRQIEGREVNLQALTHAHPEQPDQPRRAPILGGAAAQGGPRARRR